MVAATSCKLLRFLVPSGGRVAEGEPFCEVEVMKMCMPLLAPAQGAIKHHALPGAAVQVRERVCKQGPQGAIQGLEVA